MLLEKDMYIIGTYLKHKENYLKLIYVFGSDAT